VEVTIEIYGLELHGYHGVLPREQRDGQKFLFDVTLIAHDAGARTDKLKDTIDYTQVARCIREVSDGQRHNLIEALALRGSDELLQRFDVSRVRVRVRKPQVELSSPVEFTAAIVERSRR